MAIKSLDTDQQISIQALIRSWEGKLTWDLLVTKIKSNFKIVTTRQTLDKYPNIKKEYKTKKQALKGRLVSTANAAQISILQKDINLAEKVIQLKTELKVAKDEIGYLQAFIQKLADISQSNPAVMEVFSKILREIENDAK